MVEQEPRRSRRRRPGDRRDPPEPVGGVVEALFARLGIAEKVERASVIANWEKLVGSPIARVARPVGLRGETLFVEVESASWRMELSLMRPQLMAKLNAGRRSGRIEKIVFVQADGTHSEERDGEG
jgi:predicted nucleic acid-binding Zn ribbon protein